MEQPEKTHSYRRGKQTLSPTASVVVFAWHERWVRAGRCGSGVPAHRMRISVGTIDGKQASALMSQIRIIDTKRLVNKVGFIDKEVFERIRKAVKDML